MPLLSLLSELSREVERPGRNAILQLILQSPQLYRDNHQGSPGAIRIGLTLYFSVAQMAQPHE